MSVHVGERVRYATDYLARMSQHVQITTRTRKLTGRVVRILAANVVAVEWADGFVSHLDMSHISRIEESAHESPHSPD